MPATASATAPTLDDYGRLPEFEDAVISDDGNRIAMLMTVEGKRWVLVKEGDAFIQKFNVNEVKVRDLRWAGNDILLISTSWTQPLYNFNVDQAEFTQTLAANLKTGAAEYVFEKQRRLLESTFGIYGTRIIGGVPYLFAGGVELENQSTSMERIYRYVGGKPSLYQVDLNTMKATQVSRAPRDDVYRDWMLDEAGSIAAMLDIDRSSGVFKLRSQNGDIVTQGKSANGSVSLEAFGRNGDSVIFSQVDDDDGFLRYREVPMSGGEPVEIFTDFAIDGLYTGKGNRLTGYLQERRDGSGKIDRVFYDPALNSKVEKIAKAFPKHITRLGSSSDGYKRVLVRTNGNRDSGTWFDVDLERLAANAIGYERMAIEPDYVGPISNISYPAEDGLKIDAILTLPPGKEAKNLPVVVMPHGGPTSQDRPEFDWWAQALASRGYAVLQPNFRGSTNRGRDFVRAGYGEWGRKMQTDLSDGLAYLAAEGIADPKRACIMGASYGGYAALAGVTLQNGIYRCAVSVAGVSDLSKMVSTDIKESGSDPMLKRNLLEQIGKGRDLKDVSPRRFAEQASAPILLIHGKDDIVVPFNQSEMMADALKDAGKPYDLITLDGEDHWLSKSETRLKMLKAAVGFVEQHNPPK